jgi:hypothetical protein
VTNRLDPYHTGPATGPAAEPTPTELLAWLRGRGAVVDRRFEAHREEMLRALEVKLEPVTKQLSELQLQADATDRQVEDVTRHLRSHVVAEQPHSLTSYPIPRLRQVEDLVHGVRRDLAELRRHFDQHETQHDVSAEEPNGRESGGVLAGPTGDGQSDLTMIKYAMQLGTAHGIFARVAADPTVTREGFDLAVHEYREQVFELTRQMRIELASREGQGAQATNQ